MLTKLNEKYPNLLYTNVQKSPKAKCLTGKSPVRDSL